jgi:hypothetical protein
MLERTKKGKKDRNFVALEVKGLFNCLKGGAGGASVF